MQSKQELDTWYSKQDPWSYKDNPHDIRRKEIILSHLKGEYKRALDIGAGEGWLTKDLPAKEIHGIEVSDVAASRFPENVKRVHKPEGKYDLIIATGVFYDQYDYKQMHQWILDHASGLVLTSNIKSWERPLPKKPFFEDEYEYRDYTQHLIFEVSTNQHGTSDLLCFRSSLSVFL